MTLIAVHRLSRSAVFLSDTRLSESVPNPTGTSTVEIQGDEVAKFIDIDNRIRLFAAGPVSFWQRAAAEIARVADQITLDNAAEMNGPLHEAVGRLAGSVPLQRDADGHIVSQGAGALGFVLDAATKTNRVLDIRVSFGRGATVEEVPPGTSRLIGSGSQLAGLEERFHTTATDALRFPVIHDDDPDSLVTLFNLLRAEILSVYAAAGPGSHVLFKAGSVLVGGVLLDDWSCLVGEEVHEYRSSSGSSVYTLVQDGGGLVVRSADGETALAPLDRAATRVSGRPIDPQRRERAARLQDRFPDGTTVYRVVQWSHDPSRWAGFELQGRALDEIVREGIGAEARAFRSVYRIDATTREVLNLASRQSDDLTTREVAAYPDVQNYHFTIDEDNRAEFESGAADHAFDHDWWRRFLPGYDGLLFSDPEAAQRP